MLGTLAFRAVGLTPTAMLADGIAGDGRTRLRRLRFESETARMSKRFSYGFVTRGLLPVDRGERCVFGACSRPRPELLRPAVIGLLAVVACKVHAQEPAKPADNAASASAPAACLPGGDGYLRARLSGAVKAELVWGNAGTECSGAVRPTDGGIRMRFSRADAEHHKLVLVFGITGLREGEPGRTLPVNITVIREGRGEFYSTRGDDKCMLDKVEQQPIVGIPHRSRSYRIVARGFCTEPARAVRGKGSILLSRFDYAGRVDFESEDKTEDEAMTAGLP